MLSVDLGAVLGLAMTFPTRAAMHFWTYRRGKPWPRTPIKQRKKTPRARLIDHWRRGKMSIGDLIDALNSLPPRDRGARFDTGKVSNQTA